MAHPAAVARGKADVVVRCVKLWTRTVADSEYFLGVSGRNSGRNAVSVPVISVLIWTEQDVLPSYGVRRREGAVKAAKPGGHLRGPRRRRNRWGVPVPSRESASPLWGRGRCEPAPPFRCPGAVRTDSAGWALRRRNPATTGRLDERGPVVSTEFECAGKKVHRGALRSEGAPGLQIPQRPHTDVRALGQLELGEAGRSTQIAQQCGEGARNGHEESRYLAKRVLAPLRHTADASGGHFPTPGRPANRNRQAPTARGPAR